MKLQNRASEVCVSVYACVPVYSVSRSKQPSVALIDVQSERP